MGIICILTQKKYIQSYKLRVSYKKYEISCSQLKKNGKKLGMQQNYTKIGHKLAKIEKHLEKLI